MSVGSPATTLDPVQLWCGVLRAGLGPGGQLGDESLHGAIQFELGDAGFLAFVELERGVASLHEGLSREPRAWIRAEDEALRVLLSSSSAPASELRVFGDVSLVRGFFAGLTARAPRTALALRAGGAA